MKAWKRRPARPKPLEYTSNRGTRTEKPTGPDRRMFGRSFVKNFRPGLRREARASSQIPPLAQPLADVIHTRAIGLRPQMAPPQIGFAFAEGKRVKGLRVRPHKATAEDAAAMRGREVVAPRSARERRGEVPRAATEHPARACCRAYRIGCWQHFIVPLIQVPHPLPHVPALIVQSSSIRCLRLHCVRRISGIVAVPRHSVHRV